MLNFQIENRRYTGSKAKLTDWIFELIQKECSGDSFADIFAGTGVVAARAVESFKHVVLNDLLYSNNVVYKAFFGKGSWDEDKLTGFAKRYNKLNYKKLKGNYFSGNFGGKYFDKGVSKIIGYIREDIECNRNKLTAKEYNILLTSLIYSMDKIANTVGHFDAYFMKEPEHKNLDFKLINPLKVEKVDIFRNDANVLSKRLSADIVYIDPPYNSRQYSRFYHIYETLIKWDEPRLFGVALKPEPENMSEYCKVKASSAFEDLVNNLQCKYIVVSYNNNYQSKSNSSRNKIATEDIEKILKRKGKIKQFRRSHKYFNAGNTYLEDHQEIIFIAKTHKNGN